MWVLPWKPFISLRGLYKRVLAVALLRERMGTPMPLDEQWESAWALVNRSFRSSLHYAFASVNADGTPHVTPIGSLMLRHDEPTGFYFELFTKQLPHNL